MSKTNRVLAEVHHERLRQDARWGQQNHSTYFQDAVVAYTQEYREKAELYKLTNDARIEYYNRKGAAPDRNCTWDTIWLEEVFEALAEEDPQKRRAELVQAAAVAVAMIECIDREAAGG